VEVRVVGVAGDAEPDVDTDTVALPPRARDVPRSTTVVR
jgi:hypothetical protein